MKLGTRHVLIGTALAVAAFAVFGRGHILPKDGRAVAASDTAWYSESDAALIGRTGRPQLLEFFHPG